MVLETLKAIRLMLFLTVVTGFLYTGMVTGLGGLLFPSEAAGSLVRRDGQVVGSALIGQLFTGPSYFHPRPSASGYDGLHSGGSNLGPTSAQLADRVRGDLARFRIENPACRGPVPADLVTASGSSLDPHISPASAEAQIDRVALARRLDPAQVRQLVADMTEARGLGFIGEPRVNVLGLNMMLDERFPAPSDSGGAAVIRDRVAAGSKGK